jgi:hypothetical protein
MMLIMTNKGFRFILIENRTFVSVVSVSAVDEDETTSHCPLLSKASFILIGLFDHCKRFLTEEFRYCTCVVCLYNDTTRNWNINGIGFGYRVQNCLSIRGSSCFVVLKETCASHPTKQCSPISAGIWKVNMLRTERRIIGMMMLIMTNKGFRFILIENRTFVSVVSVSAVDEDETTSHWLTTTGYLEIVWQDEFLSWDPLSYGGLEYVYIPQGNVWKPDISLQNGFENLEELGSKFIQVYVTSDGYILWKPFQIFDWE